MVALDLLEARRGAVEHGIDGIERPSLVEMIRSPNRRANGHYERQLVIAREIGDRHGEGNALGNLGIAYTNLGETRRTIDLYE
jgi:hypothetical protein